MIVVGVDLESSRRAVDLAEQHSEIFALVGRHPNYAHEFIDDELRTYEEWLAHPRVVGLGEIGLDFHWDFATPEQQETCLNAQLDLAASLNCPTIFHCRKANDELLALLERRQTCNVLLHCFSGDRVHAERAIALGATLGFDGPITYKKSEETREIIRSIPRDRIVIETDSPYLTPEPFRSKPNEPAFVRIVNEALARILETSAEESARLTTENAERFFQLG